MIANERQFSDFKAAINSIEIKAARLYQQYNAAKQQYSILKNKKGV